MSITHILMWLGFSGELIARLHVPDGIVGAIIVGFLAIVLIVGVFHFHIPGEPVLSGVPLLSSIIVSALLVAVWNTFAYRRVQPYYYARYNRRGGSVRRPRRRRFF